MAFFSGQDISTLKSEGNDTNCFVSLIVDTRGTYVAAVTRKVEVKSEVTVKTLGKSYEFFGDGEFSLTDGGTETTEVLDDVTIEYFDLTVEREETDNPLDYLDRRFEEIEKAKEEAKKYRIPSYSDYTSAVDSVKTKKEPKELSFWDWDVPTTPKGSDYDIDMGKWYVPDKDLVHKSVCHMVTCSLVLNTEKFDMKQWIKKHMKKMYKKMFPETESTGPSLFGMWSEFIVDFILESFIDPAAPPIDEGDYMSAVAQAMVEELTPYREDNEYIAAYCELLEQYII